MELAIFTVILTTLPLYSSLGDYSFQYRVNNNDASVQYSHEEDRIEDDTAGHYQVLLPDGRTQVVTYSVPDKDTGYLAQVDYQLRERGTQRKREIISKVYTKPLIVKERRKDTKYQTFIKKLYGIYSKSPSRQTIEPVVDYNKEQQQEVKTSKIIQTKSVNTINDKNAYNANAHDKYSEDRTGELSVNHTGIIMAKVKTEKMDILDNILDEEFDPTFQTNASNLYPEYTSTEKEDEKYDMVLREDTTNSPVKSMEPKTKQTYNKTMNITEEFHTSMSDKSLDIKLIRLEKIPIQSSKNQQLNANSGILGYKSTGKSDFLAIPLDDHELSIERKHIVGEKDKNKENERQESDLDYQINDPVILEESTPANEIYNDVIEKDIFEENAHNQQFKGADQERNKVEHNENYQNFKTSMTFPDKFQSKENKKMQSINKQAFFPKRYLTNNLMMKRQRFPFKPYSNQKNYLAAFRNKRKVSAEAISYFKCIKTFLYNLLTFDL